MFFAYDIRILDLRYMDYETTSKTFFLLWSLDIIFVSFVYFILNYQCMVSVCLWFYIHIICLIIIVQDTTHIHVCIQICCLKSCFEKSHSLVVTRKPWGLKPTPHHTSLHLGHALYPTRWSRVGLIMLC